MVGDFVEVDETPRSTEELQAAGRQRQERRRRQRLFGNVIKSVTRGVWTVSFDDGTQMDVSASKMKIEARSAGVEHSSPTLGQIARYERLTRPIKTGIVSESGPEGML